MISWTDIIDNILIPTRRRYVRHVHQIQTLKQFLIRLKLPLKLLPVGGPERGLYLKVLIKILLPAQEYTIDPPVEILPKYYLIQHVVLVYLGDAEVLFLEGPAIDCYLHHKHFVEEAGFKEVLETEVVPFVGVQFEELNLFGVAEDFGAEGEILR